MDGLIILVMIAAYMTIVHAQSLPHFIEGRVFTNGSNGVQEGIPVAINETVSGDYAIVNTEDPGPPELRGIYSATLTGTTGDLVIVTAWNATHFGMSNQSLAETTTTINVVLNRTRPSEANVTILQPLNNSLKNKSIAFNVTANVTILGNDGVDCNATINFTDKSLINISSGEGFSKSLGNISLGGSMTANWSVIGLNAGASNITVSAYCGSDGIKLDRYDKFTVNNITIANTAPGISRISLTDPIDLIPGGNLTVYCNITVSENNTAADIMGVNATFYQLDVGPSAIDDNNNHYTNNSCTNISSSEFELNYSCSFRVAYYANNGSWQCNATVIDFSNATVYENISSYINEFMAINIFPTTIDYGVLKVQNISPEFNLTISNFGNVAVNVTVRGFAPNESLSYLNISMTCENGNISNANHRFSVLNGTGFADMASMNNDTQTINFTLPQRINDISFGNDTNSTFWKLQLPPVTGGICNGTLLFSALTTK